MKYLCDEERRKRADEDGVSENEVEQEDCPGGYADLEAKGRGGCLQMNHSEL